MDYFFMQNKLKYKTLRTPIENEELIRKAFLWRFFVLALQKHRWTSKVGYIEWMLARYRQCSNKKSTGSVKSARTHNYKDFNISYLLLEISTTSDLLRTNRLDEIETKKNLEIQLTSGRPQRQDGEQQQHFSDRPGPVPLLRDRAGRLDQAPASGTFLAFSRQRLPLVLPLCQHLEERYQVRLSSVIAAFRAPETWHSSQVAQSDPGRPGNKNVTTASVCKSNFYENEICPTIDDRWK